MDKADIERLMNARVKEIKNWDVNDSNNIITGLVLRKYSCSATPIEHVFEERRKEIGVSFKLEWKGETGNSYCHLNLRLRTIYFGTGPTPPYVVIYVIDDSKKDESGKDDEITHFDINEKNIDQALVLKSWLKKWLQKALSSKKHNKIFQYQKKS